MIAETASDSMGRDAQFVLPYGVTGFRDVNESPLPETDFREVVARCHAAARSLSAKVLASIAAPQRPPANFGVVTLGLPGRTINVFVNAIYPIVGFAHSPGAKDSNVTFVDEPELAAMLQNAGAWQILPKVMLDCPVTQDSLAQLGPGERHEIRYWKPRRIGDIVFNLWD